MTSVRENGFCHLQSCRQPKKQLETKTAKHLEKKSEQHTVKGLEKSLETSKEHAPCDDHVMPPKSKARALTT